MLKFFFFIKLTLRSGAFQPSWIFLLLFMKIASSAAVRHLCKILEVVLLLKYLTVILFCVHTEFMHAAPNLRDHRVGIFLTWREQNVSLLRHRWYRPVFIERRKSIYLSCFVLNRRVHECLSSADTCLLSTWLCDWTCYPPSLVWWVPEHIPKGFTPAPSIHSSNRIPIQYISHSDGQK